MSKKRFDENTIVANNAKPEAFSPHSQGVRPESNHASVQASYPDSLINTIRKTIKSVGKEVSFVRLTPDEKNRLMDIVYTYKRIVDPTIWFSRRFRAQWCFFRWV
ncbi:MAG: hypothetical protein C4291_14935 [Candidatus Dadabacteria bacterium]